MDYPFFSLKSPITDFQIEIDRFIKVFNELHFPKNHLIRLFGVPLSQVINKKKADIPNNIQRDGLFYGKISILIINKNTYAPVAAVLIEDTQNRKITEGMLSLMTEVRFPWLSVTKSNFKFELTKKLPSFMSNDQTHQANEKIGNFTEQQVARLIKQRFFGLNHYIRIMEQISLSDVIDTLSLENKALKRPVKQILKPTTEQEFVSSVKEFENLDHQEKYYYLNQFASASNFDLIVIEKIDDDEGPWWPILAIELDGKDHDRPHQKFADYKKDVICQESLLPMLRIRLIEENKKLGRLAKDYIEQLNYYDKNFEIDLIFYLISKCMLEGMFHQHKIKQAERRKWISIARKAKVLSQKESISIEDAFSKIPELRMSEDEWQKNIEEEMIEHYEREFDRNEFSKELAMFVAMYGKYPEFKIDVDASGALSGSLLNYKIPEVIAFCDIVKETEMRWFLYDFGTSWLLKQALQSKLKR
jgi:uncharacterized ubiquitin-like protein YukD